MEPTGIPVRSPHRTKRERDIQPKQTWTYHHASVFCLTFICYASFHATRKCFSNVKDDVADAWTPSPANGSHPVWPNSTWYGHNFYPTKDSSKLFLGTLDAVFLFSYAFGLFFSGFFADRLDKRYILAFGMSASSILVLLFGSVTEWTHFYSRPFYLAIWCVNGLLQSLGWPTVVAVMGNWFGEGSRGFVLGVWSSCASVGNVFGALLVAALLDYGYEYGFLVTSSILFAMSIVIFFGLVVTPTDVGLPMPFATEPDSPTAGSSVYRDVQIDREDGLLTDALLPNPTSLNGKSEPNNLKAISFTQAVLLPGVITYSLAYACLKLVNYAFFFWLPFYLSNALKWDDSVADDISTFYDIGGIVGGILGGLLSDWLHQRGIVVAPMLTLGFGSLFLYTNSPRNKAINSFLLAVAGFFIGGPANLISAAISADLGQNPMIRGSHRALATVTGIVDGTGSVGAAFGQYLVPLIQLHFDWHWVFYFFMFMLFLTVVCLSPVVYKEGKQSGCQPRSEDPVWQSVDTGRHVNTSFSDSDIDFPS